MWMRILYCTKFESSPEYKSFFKYTMLYLIMLIITGLEFLKGSKKNQINLWPKYNLMALDRTIVKIWNK